MTFNLWAVKLREEGGAIRREFRGIIAPFKVALAGLAQRETSGIPADHISRYLILSRAIRAGRSASYKHRRHLRPASYEIRTLRALSATFTAPFSALR